MLCTSQSAKCLPMLHPDIWSSIRNYHHWIRTSTESKRLQRKESWVGSGIHKREKEKKHWIVMKLSWYIAWLSDQEINLFCCHGNKTKGYWPSSITLLFLNLSFFAFWSLSPIINSAFFFLIYCYYFFLFCSPFFAHL